MAHRVLESRMRSKERFSGSQMLINFWKAVAAGMCIGMGSAINIYYGGLIGAIFFAIGLVIIYNLKLKLFTGIIGYAFEENQYPITVLFGNLIGCALMFYVDHDNAATIIMEKLSLPWYDIIIRGIMCGAIIYSSTHCTDNVLSTIFHVAAFILLGADHCIADACYIFASRILNLSTLCIFLYALLGNTIGALSLHYMSMAYKRYNTNSVS